MGLNEIVKPTAPEVRQMIVDELAPLKAEIAALKARLRIQESMNSHRSSSRGFSDQQ